MGDLKEGASGHVEEEGPSAGALQVTYPSPGSIIFALQQPQVDSTGALLLEPSDDEAPTASLNLSASVIAADGSQLQLPPTVCVNLFKLRSHAVALVANGFTTPPSIFSREWSSHGVPPGTTLMEASENSMKLELLQVRACTVAKLDSNHGDSGRSAWNAVLQVHDLGIGHYVAVVEATEGDIGSMPGDDLAVTIDESPKKKSSAPSSLPLEAGASPVGSAFVPFEVVKDVTMARNEL